MNGILQMKISLHWKWFDLWVGVYVDRPNRTIYVCPLPTVVIKIRSQP